MKRRHPHWLRKTPISACAAKLPRKRRVQAQSESSESFSQSRPQVVAIITTSSPIYTARLCESRHLRATRLLPVPQHASARNHDTSWFGETVLSKHFHPRCWKDFQSTELLPQGAMAHLLSSHAIHAHLFDHEHCDWLFGLQHGYPNLMGIERFFTISCHHFLQPPSLLRQSQDLLERRIHNVTEQME